MTVSRRTQGALFAFLVLLAGGGVSGVIPPYYTGLVVQVLCFAILAMSLDLLVGVTGLPSLGHAAFFGISAYTVALMSLRLTDNALVLLPAGILASAVLAMLFGVLALRTGGAYFLMVTLALAQLVWAVAVGWRALTGGDDGIPRIPPLRVGAWVLAGESNYLVFAVLVFIAVTLAMVLLLESPFGRALRGIRESELRMRVLGYDTWRYKYAAFVISGTVAGVGGVLFLHFHSFVSPEVVSVIISAEALLMVIVGGAGTLFGPVLGAALVVLLRHVVSGYTDRWLLVLGIVYVLAAIFVPRGIVGELQARLGRRRPR